jgi:hypothetical protein
MQMADFCAPSYSGGEEVLILSYEAAQQHAVLLKSAPPFALLVCDEAHRLKKRMHSCIPILTQVATLCRAGCVTLCAQAHRLKNRKAKSYLNLDALAATRRVLLTGNTPLQNEHLISLVITPPCSQAPRCRMSYPSTTPWSPSPRPACWALSRSSHANSPSRSRPAVYYMGWRLQPYGMRHNVAGWRLQP